MNIVVLDVHTLNPGDLDWADLKALGPCVIHDRTPAAEIIARSAGAEIVITNKVPFSRETLQALPKLRAILPGGPTRTKIIMQPAEPLPLKAHAPFADRRRPHPEFPPNLRVRPALRAPQDDPCAFRIPSLRFASPQHPLQLLLLFRTQHNNGSGTAHARYLVITRISSSRY